MAAINDAVVGWVRNVVGGAIGSKKTLAAGSAVTVLGMVAVKFIQNTLVVCTALVCASICFCAWLLAQSKSDQLKASKDIVEKQ